MAVENGQGWPSGGLLRSPGRLVIKARIEWLTASKIHVGLPEYQVVVGGESMTLPRTSHKLDRHIEQAPWERLNGEPGAPCQWRNQPFYPKVRGRWYAAETATYYNYEAWKVYNQCINETLQPPKDLALEQCARLLGIENDANRREINEAFRLMVKRVHPDFGGSPDEFQRLLAARNTLLVKCSSF